MTTKCAEQDQAELVIVAPLLLGGSLLRGAMLGLGLALIAIALLAIHRLRSRRVPSGRATTLGPYEIVRKLGEGGMGTVYEARHALLRRRTALKLIKPSRLDAIGEARFEREARLTSELIHPNTVALYDYGRTTEGVYYYAMELVDGITLHELVRSEGTVHAGRTLRLLRQVAASLAQAHRSGVIHRDIKPANVMVCYQDGHPDCVKVLDFGLAKRLGPTEADCGISYANAAVGTPEFMAPEAAYHAESVNAATDVYAVGILGYFLLTGEVPFQGRNARAIAHAHLSEPPLPPSLRTRKDVPAGLERVVMTCLAKEPASRYEDGWALLCALEACEGDSSWTSKDARRWWETRRAPSAGRSEARAVGRAGASGPRTVVDAPDTEAFHLARPKRRANRADRSEDLGAPRSAR